MTNNNGLLSNDDRFSNLEGEIKDIREEMIASDVLLQITTDCTKQILREYRELKKEVQSLKAENQILKTCQLLLLNLNKKN